MIRAQPFHAVSQCLLARKTAERAWKGISMLQMLAHLFPCLPERDGTILVEAEQVSVKNRSPLARGVLAQGSI